MTNEPTEFSGYSLFTEILSPTIRAWNRANIIYNIKERHGNAVATKYVEHFSKDEMTAVYSVMLTVAAEGYENVRRTIFREVNEGDALNA